MVTCAGKRGKSGERIPIIGKKEKEERYPDREQPPRTSLRKATRKGEKKRRERPRREVKKKGGRERN